MNKLFLSLALLAFSTLAHASILNAPFSPEEDHRFDAIESGIPLTCTGSVISGSRSCTLSTGAVSTASIANGSLTVAKAAGEAGGAQGTFLATTGKGVVNVTGAAGTYSSTLVIPANAIIRQVWFFVETAILPSGTTTSWQCNTAGDLLTATDESGVAANGIFAGIPVGTAATMVYSSAGCTIQVVTAVHTATAGKFDVFADYVIAK